MTEHDSFRHRAVFPSATGLLCLTLLLVWSATGRGQDEFEPADAGTPAPSVDAQVPLPEGTFPHGGQARVRHIAGSGVANRNSYTALDINTPVFNYFSTLGDEFIGLVEGRVLIDNQADWAGSVGFELRRYFAGSDQVLGGGVHFMLDGTHASTFQQIIVNGVRYGQWVDVSVTGYLPVGDTQRPLRHGPTSTTPTFMGTNLVFARDRFDEAANRGVQAEALVHLPGDFARTYDLTVGAGGYYFDSDAGDSFGGVQARARASVLPNLQVQFLVTHDDVFDTNLLVGVLWNFSRFFYSEPEAPRPVQDRIADFANRFDQVVVREVVVSDPVIITGSGGTGGGSGGGSGGGTGGGSGGSAPLRILHVDSSAAPGGDGSLMSPFATLAEAEADSQPGDIIYLHADSVFANQMIALQNQQRLLGEGVPHTIDTDMGPITLPPATGGTNLPIIADAPSTVGKGAITLADDVEVNGVIIRDAHGPAIYGDGIGGTVTIANTTITGSSSPNVTFRGLELRNNAATVAIDGLQVENTVDDAILIADAAASSVITLTGTTAIDNAGGVSLSVLGNAGSISVDDLLITNRGSTAIRIGRNTGTITFNKPLSIDNPNGSPDTAIGIADSSGDVTFGDVTITDLNRAAVGQAAVLLGDNGNTVTFASLNITTNMGGGIRAHQIGNLVIGGGTLDTQNGPAIEINGIQSADIQFKSVSTTDAPFGILLATTDSGFTGNLTITGDGEHMGTGGVMRNVETGVIAGNVENVILNFLDIQSSATGVSGFDTNNLVVNASMLTGTADDWSGVFVANSDMNKPGTPVIVTGSSITSSGANAFGLNYTNNKSEPGFLRLDDTTFTLTGTNAVGVSVTAVGDPGQAGAGDVTLQSLQNNTATVPGGQVFVGTEMNATIFGQLLINGTLFP